MDTAGWFGMFGPILLFAAVVARIIYEVRQHRRREPGDYYF